jgi:endoglucanase
MTYQSSVPVVGEAYASSSYQDELTLAALFLASAENSSQRYEEAEGYYKQFELSGYDGVFNWDSKTPGLAVLFSQLAQVGLGGDMSKWQTEAERYFDNIVNKKGPGFLTSGECGILFHNGEVLNIWFKGGLLWYDGDSDDASLNPALNAAMLLTRYAPMATSPDKATAYLVSQSLFSAGAYISPCWI